MRHIRPQLGLTYLIRIFVVWSLTSAALAGRVDSDRYSDDGETNREELALFCNQQRDICLNMCKLQARYRANCTFPCKNRVAGCIRSGCYNWIPADFRIAVKYGGQQCF